MVQREHGCALGAVALPAEPGCLPEHGDRCRLAFFCFERGRFRKVPGLKPSRLGPGRNLTPP